MLSIVRPYAVAVPTTTTKYPKKRTEKRVGEEEEEGRGHFKPSQGHNHAGWVEKEEERRRTWNLNLGRCMDGSLYVVHEYVVRMQ